MVGVTAEGVETRTGGFLIVDCDEIQGTIQGRCLLKLEEFLENERCMLTN